MRVLVTGGTGRLGATVVAELQQRGHDPVTLSRKSRPGVFVGDLATGIGLPAALEGVDAIVHAASDPRGDAAATDIVGTQRLAAAGVPVLYVSIVGVDVHPYSYYRTKYLGEQALAEAAAEWTVLRATQFHAFVDDLLTMSKQSIGARIPGLKHSESVPVLVPKGLRTQPVAHQEVAFRIAELITSGPTGGVEQFAGPEQLTSHDLARAWAQSRGGRVVALPTMGKVARAFRDGASLPAVTVERGSQTWLKYLNNNQDPATPL